MKKIKLRSESVPSVTRWLQDRAAGLTSEHHVELEGVFTKSQYSKVRLLSGHLGSVIVVYIWIKWHNLCNKLERKSFQVRLSGSFMLLGRVFSLFVCLCLFVCFCANYSYQADWLMLLGLSLYTELGNFTVGWFAWMKNDLRVIRAFFRNTHVFHQLIYYVLKCGKVCLASPYKNKADKSRTRTSACMGSACVCYVSMQIPESFPSSTSAL